MTKMVNIECPHCKRINTCKVGFFHRNKITCECGNVINIKTSLIKTKECPHCGNLIVYNRAKTDDPICPICKKPLLDGKEDIKLCEIVCPNCSCHIVTSKNEKTVTCPICEENIDIMDRLRQQQYIEQAHPTLLKCSLEGDYIVYKHPLEDFALGSQIIVNESQVAVFLRDGKSLGVFESGRHMVTLNHLMLGKDTYDVENASFHSQLYYISRAIQTGFKWGTDTKIRMFDPASGLHVELGAFGSYSFAVSAYDKFIFNCVGLNNIPSYGVNAGELTDKLRPIIVSAVKTNIAKVIREENINILEVDEHLTEIGANLLLQINVNISKYGLELKDFAINISTPDDDPNFKRMKEQYAERYLKVQNERIKQAEAEAAHSRIMSELNIEADVELTRAKIAAEKERILAQGSADAYRAQAFAEADEMKAKGYTYDDETKRQVSNKVADSLSVKGSGGNDGNSLFTSMTEDAVKANLIKETSKQVTKDIMSTFNEGGFDLPKEETKTVSNDGWDCPKCGNKNINSKFCPECGTQRPSASWDCPNCGTKGINTKFCPECGYKRDE